MADNNLVKIANKCVVKRVPITSAPLWHMGQVAVNSSQESFDLLQNTIDYLTCKAKAGISFTVDEKEFMVELYESFWWGGKYKGYPEAATLANHYVNGGGKTLNINSGAYSTSVIVKDTMLAMKEYIKDKASKNIPFVLAKSSDVAFYKSKHASHLMRGKRSQGSQGHIFNNGVLMAEQSNGRLMKADNRFYLNVTTTKGHSHFMSRWSVESIYDFESFQKNYITHIPLSGKVLKLPDGLSQYLVTIGVAKDFKYIAQWGELWK